MIQLKLFLDNSEIILAQAGALNIPLYDCDVKFDLRQCPPAIEVTKYTETLRFDETRSTTDSHEDRKSVVRVSGVYH